MDPKYEFHGYTRSDARKKQGGSTPRVSAVVGIKGTLSQLLQSGFLSDVTFTFDEPPSSVRAHKLMLAISSPVFHAMFYGPAKDTSDIVAISDIEERAFKLILDYIYTRNVMAEIPLETTIDAFYAARKYELPDLEATLTRRMQNAVTVNTVATLLRTAILFDLIRLEHKCWNVIELDTQRFFESDDFCTLEKDLLKKILSRVNLSASEIHIYNGVVRWAEEQCLQANIPKDATNLRDVLEEILPLIRFPLMSPSELANGPVSSGILSADEVSNIFLTKYGSSNTPNKKPEPMFSPKRRTIFPNTPAPAPPQCLCPSQSKNCSFCQPVDVLLSSIALSSQSSSADAFHSTDCSSTRTGPAGRFSDALPTQRQVSSSSASNNGNVALATNPLASSQHFLQQLPPPGNYDYATEDVSTTPRRSTGMVVCPQPYCGCRTRGYCPEAGSAFQQRDEQESFSAGSASSTHYYNGVTQFPQTTGRLPASTSSNSSSRTFHQRRLRAIRRAVGRVLRPLGLVAALNGLSKRIMHTRLYDDACEC